MFPITFDFCFYFEVNGPNRFHFLFKVPSVVEIYRQKYIY